MNHRISINISHHFGKFIEGDVIEKFQGKKTLWEFYLSFVAALYLLARHFKNTNLKRLVGWYDYWVITEKSDSWIVIEKGRE